MKILAILLLHLFFTFQLSSEELHPASKVELISNLRSVKKGDPLQIGFYIHIKKGWHTYWKNPGDIGRPLEIEGITTEEPLTWPHPQRITYKNWTSFGYTQNTLIKSTVVVPKNYKKNTFTLKGQMEWLVCKKVCLPLKQNIQLNLPIKAQSQVHKIHDSLFKKFSHLYPKPSSLKGVIEQKNNTITLNLPSQKQIQEVFPLFQAKHSNFKIQKKEEKSNFQSIVFQKKSKTQIKQAKALVVFKNKDGSFQSSEVTFSQKTQDTLLFFLLLAFLGGIILNFMPCVLPVVFLKFYHALLSPRKKLILSSFSYSAGIVVSFIALSLLIQILKSGSEFIGWGFQMQSPAFILFLILFFSLIIFTFLDLIPFPLFLKTPSNNNSTFLNNFITGSLAVISASPCTAPFMGVAMGYAFSQNFLISLFLFLSLGIGMSFPYVLLCLFPQFLKYIPRPGPWSLRLKKLMALPLYASVLWLLYILSQLNPKLVLPCLLGLSILTLILILKKMKHLSRWGVIVLLALGIVTIVVSYKFSPRPKQNIYSDFSLLELNKLKMNNQSVLVYFTARWCITCKFNEWTTLQNPQLIDFLSKHNIVVMKGDWTSKNPEISKMLEQYDRAGIPFTIYFHFNEEGEEIILPEILSPSIVINAIKNSAPEI